MAKKQMKQKNPMRQSAVIPKVKQPKGVKINDHKSEITMSGQAKTVYHNQDMDDDGDCK